MYFKKLEIFGFKSFAEKTVLNFESGITAIVGPNGCGKSNIVDAIRWVLGEQSAKELRGSAMEDVIFNGTDSKGSLGFAEVSLSFTNEGRALPIEYDDVTVTRRLFRSGESEYLLNKSVVRLKDILELFMGTGIGSEAYSLVQQGKVDLIVSARPEDRRIILDEAAGITKYKSKKREALNKLEDTENNLLRLNDIILEVKRQIASLERQANKARRYKEEYEKLKILEVKLAGCQLNVFKQQKDSLNCQLVDSQHRQGEFDAELNRLNELINKENALGAQIEERIRTARDKDLKLANQIELDGRQIEFNGQRIEDIIRSQERLSQQRSQLEDRCQMQQGKIDALHHTLTILRDALQKNIQLLKEKKNLLAVIAEDIKNAKESIKKDEGRILTLTSQEVAVKNQLTEVMKEFQGFLARKRRLEIENDKVICEKQEADNKLYSVEEAIKQCCLKIEELKAQQELKIQAVDDLKNSLAAMEDVIKKLEQKKLSLKSQKEFIEELRVQYQDMPDPVAEGVLLTATPPLNRSKGIIGKVKEVRLADSARYAELKNNLSSFNAASLYEIVCETKFIELDPQGMAEKIQQLASEIAVLFKQKENSIAEIDSQQEQINALEIKIHDVEKALSSAQTQKNTILEESNKLSNELNLVGSELKEARTAMVSLKNKEDELNVRLEAINQEVNSLQVHIAEEQNLIAAQSQKREETTVAAAQLEAEIESHSDNEKNQRENLTMFEKDLAGSQKEIKQLEGESADYQAKKKQCEEEIAQLKIHIEGHREKRQSLSVVLSDYAIQKKEITERITSLYNNIASVEKSIESLKGEIHAQQLKSQELSFQEKSIKDKLLQTYKINLDEPPAIGQTAQAAGENRQIQEGQPQAALSSQQLLAASDSPTDKNQTAAQIPEEINPEELNIQIEQLKKRCDTFGSVNLVAIEESDELRERFEFLTKQQSDLLTAKEALHQTISKINRTTRQIFLDTFTRVSEEFRIYFRMLFGGGEAQLVLVDPENVLESGIDIIARPPGKKLQNITLLSGGEKSLAAIALIFGVFKVRPSPFCVLDEIDAALDESNVGRFGYLLKDFAKIAQFIVITHNKKTITHANVMYGITMQERGISRIVSVKFAEDEKKEDIEAVAVGV